MYDWPEKLVYVTPSTHRILNKKSVEINGEEKLVNEKDTHTVFVRPKAFVDSSGTTWANETMRLRYLHQEEFDVEDDGKVSQYSKGFRSFAHRIHDNVKYFQMTTVHDDWKRCRPGECVNEYTKYEISRFEHASKRIQAIMADVDATPDETKTFADIQLLLHKFEVSLNSGLLFLREGTGDLTSEDLFNDILLCSNEILAFIKRLDLPAVKPRWADVTDAGPGVGVSNFEVRFRDAEMALIHNSDYRVRIHNSRDGSGDNEAERTNSAIGDSIVDGATLKWEKYAKFHNLDDDAIANMTLHEYEAHEVKRMEMNAWFVTNELRDRIDGAPVFNEYINAYTTEESHNAFFLSKDLLKRYQSQQGDKQKMLPGYHYIHQMNQFIQQHYHVGELFMEYIRGGCTESGEDLCPYCSENEWVSPTMDRIPQPIPSATNPGHFEDVFETPIENRHVDDYAPRANLKKLFKQNEISSKDHEKIYDFAITFAVDSEAVAAYIRHMEELKRTSDIKAGERAKLKAEQKGKTYADFDWDELISNNRIANMTVAQLRLFLEEKHLSKVGNKRDKIERIKTHYYLHGKDVPPRRIQIPGTDGTSSDSSDEDEILRVIEHSDSGTSSSDNETIDVGLTSVHTRSGRKAGTWRNCMRN